MVTFNQFVFIYVLGGLTFLPLAVLFVLLHAHLTFPVRDELTDARDDATKKTKAFDGDAGSALEAEKLPDGLKPRAHEPDAAAGYFAVCREYVPGGVNGKPPERTTPAGAVIAAESPSVYQSMYRSIFDRNKSQAPSMEGAKGGAKTTKRARNVFFVVLRHGHLMLYDDSEQLEVRHVVSLAHHNVDVYAGGEAIPEGELWIKRNCIRLTRKRTVEEVGADPKPFYLFSENCSEKEDFYHAMLQNQERVPGSPDGPPTPQRFQTQHIIKLVQQLHASEENLQTRWINALIGRVFLAVYKTADIEDFVRNKITKKIARVPTPAFLNNIKIRNIEMGDTAPFFTNLRLKELSVDGNLTVEADVKYQGGFRLEIAAAARIELGSHFKAREVSLVLAGILRKLEGHLLVRVKPPPSNRVWISFETAPNLELSIEPIVSSRQITYGVILRAIESRIREVVAETLVHPNWDDLPFHDTMLQRFRGGIWEDDQKVKLAPGHKSRAAELGLVDRVDKGDDDSDEDIQPLSPSHRDKTMSQPSLIDSAPSGLKGRKPIGAKSAVSLDLGAEGTASGAEPRSPSKPKSLRSGSFASAADPIVNLDAATVEALKAQAKKGKGDAAAKMKDISTRSPPGSPAESPVGSPPAPASLMEQTTKIAGKRQSSSSFSSQHSGESAGTRSLQSDDTQVDSAALAAASAAASPRRAPTNASFASTSSAASAGSGTKFLPHLFAGGQNGQAVAPSPPHAAMDKRVALNASLNTATAAAKKWFANRQAGAHHTHNHNRRPSAGAPSISSSASASASASSTDLPASTDEPGPASAPANKPGTPSRPIGRGQPLPPPGTPLPGPRKGWPTVPLGGLSLARRKPVKTLPPTSPEAEGQAVPPLPKRRESPGSAGADDDATPTGATNGGNGNNGLGAGLGSNAGAGLSPASTSSVWSRKQSASSSLPRRERMSSSGAGFGAGDDGGDGLFVVEAPPVEGEAPASPAVEERKGKVEGLNNDGEEGVFGIETDVGGGEGRGVEGREEDEEGDGSGDGDKGGDSESLRMLERMAAQ